MHKKVLTFSARNRPYPFRTSKNKGWTVATLGVVGILLAALCIYALLVSSTGSATISYMPADVVYGKKIHAVHAMQFNINSQTGSLISVNSAEKPEILLSENYYNFGEVNAKQLQTRTFVIANAGQKDLIIERAYTTCGCTTADFSGNEIPPGKVVLMTLQFDPGYHDLRGATVRRGVMIETNDPDHPTQEIWVQASVR
jgi:hypothetical protein